MERAGKKWNEQANLHCIGYNSLLELEMVQLQETLCSFVEANSFLSCESASSFHSTALHSFLSLDSVTNIFTRHYCDLEKETLKSSQLILLLASYYLYTFFFFLALSSLWPLSDMQSPIYILGSASYISIEALWEKYCRQQIAPGNAKISLHYLAVSSGSLLFIYTT